MHEIVDTWGKNLVKHKWKICWLFYFVYLVMFLCASYYLRDASWIQIGILLLTVVAMILIMLKNNDHIRELTTKQIDEMNKGTREQIDSFRESMNSQIMAMEESTEKQIQAIQKASQDEIRNIQDSTQKQIQTFVEQCQGIIAQQEKIAGVLVTMSKQYAQQLEEEKKKRKLEEGKIKMIKIEQQRKLQKEIEEKERMKPNIFVRITTQNYFLFWTHYWIYLINTGCDSKDMRVESIFFASATELGTKINIIFKTISRDQQHSFDCGNVDNFRGYDSVKVRLSIRDVKERRYEGEVVFSKDDQEWYEIPLEEHATILPPGGWAPLLAADR